MSSTCISCKNHSNTIIQLICDHQLCLQCAQSIKIPQGLPPLDAKFKIICPVCRKSTTTLNILNLVKENNEKLLFVNMQSSELVEQELQQPKQIDSNKHNQSKLRRMSYTQRRSNMYADRKTPEVTDRAKLSITKENQCGSHSRQGESFFETKCSIHKESLMFYCKQEAMLMCMQCMYKHMKQKKNHNVSSVSDSIGTIISHNKQFKLDARKKIDQIDKCISICKNNKSKIDQAYEIHDQLIKHEFQELQKLIKKKQQQNKDYLQKTFKKKEKELSDQVNDLNYLKSCLKQHFDYSIENQSSHVYFFNAFSLLKTAISKFSINYKTFSKEQFTCFDRHTSIDDFQNLLSKFFKPKVQGRQSKTAMQSNQHSNAPSRGASQKGNHPKIKNQFIYEQTKKKLQKLNKLQIQHSTKDKKNKDKRQQYLNNFMIDQITKKQLEGSNYERNNPSMVNYRKSSASQYGEKKVPFKTLTPTRMSNGNSKAKKKN